MRNQHSSRLSATASAFAVAVALSAGIAPHAQAQTTTPIKHVVVIFGENISFDHYFGTYPNALNRSSDIDPLTGVVSRFIANPNTPAVNGLTPELLTNNPNLNAALTAQVNPQRLPPSQAFTCSQNHSYLPEQEAVDHGLLDRFPKFTGRTTSEGCAADGSTVLNYFDGNTVTALWNYAQNFAMSDNHFGTNFGPSTPGAINLISGQTGGATLFTFTTSINAGGTPSVAQAGSFPGDAGSVFEPTGPAAVTQGTDFGDEDAFLDDCGADAGGTVTHQQTLQMSSNNVGDLLNNAGVTWGWFQGGFAPTAAATNVGTPTFTPAVCGSSHPGHTFAGKQVPNPVVGPGADIHGAVADYVSHHEPFMFYASTTNPHHLRPTSTAMIGHTDQANHQYDTSDFFTALAANNLPAVTYLKAPAYQDAHPGNSDPLLEQTFVVQVVNALMESGEWKNTAIIVTYDDSDGWYDHVTGTIVSQSNTLNDAFSGTNACGTAPAGAIQSRCGYGPRIPFQVISPYAKQNYVDNTLIDQTSSLRFIEQNWNLGFIDGPTPPATGRSSMDRFAGSINTMFNFDFAHPTTLILNPASGLPAGL